MELDAKVKLRRFCYLGRFEPVYIHLRGSINVGMYWPQLEVLCKSLDDVAMLLILRQALQETTLVRRDEVNTKHFAIPHVLTNFVTFIIFQIVSFRVCCLFS